MENTFTRVTHMELRSFVDGLRMFYLGLTLWNHLNRPLLLVSLRKRIWPRCKNLHVEAKVQILPWISTLRIFHVKCIAWIPWVPWFLWLLRCVQYSARAARTSPPGRHRHCKTFCQILQNSAKQESLILLQILSRAHRSKNIKNQNNAIQTTGGVGPTPRNWGANMRNDRCCSKLIPTGERWWSLDWA